MRLGISHLTQQRVARISGRITAKRLLPVAGAACMSIRSLTDFMEVSLRSVRRLARTATVTGRRGRQVDVSARAADFWWPTVRPLMAISADFLVAMDKGSPRSEF
jgi:hypothetical protein